MKVNTTEKIDTLVCRHNYAAGGSIWVKFCRLMQNDMTMTINRWKSKSEIEFQYGGYSFSETGSSNISAVDWGLLSKFCAQIDVDFLKHEAANLSFCSRTFTESSHDVFRPISLWALPSPIRMTYKVFGGTLTLTQLQLPWAFAEYFAEGETLHLNMNSRSTDRRSRGRRVRHEAPKHRCLRLCLTGQVLNLNVEIDIFFSSKTDG